MQNPYYGHYQQPQQPQPQPTAQGRSVIPQNLQGQPLTAPSQPVMHTNTTTTITAQPLAHGNMPPQPSSVLAPAVDQSPVREDVKIAAPPAQTVVPPKPVATQPTPVTTPAANVPEVSALTNALAQTTISEVSTTTVSTPPSVIPDHRLNDLVPFDFGPNTNFPTSTSTAPSSSRVVQSFVRVPAGVINNPQEMMKAMMSQHSYGRGQRRNNGPSQSGPNNGSINNLSQGTSQNNGSYNQRNNNNSNNSNNSDRNKRTGGGNNAGRGGNNRTFTNPPPARGPADGLKFSEDFDFEGSNARFAKSPYADTPVPEVEAPEVSSTAPPAYEKSSFFDNISCEATDRAKDRGARSTLSEQRKLDQETFGASSRNNRNRGNQRRYNSSSFTQNNSGGNGAGNGGNANGGNANGNGGYGQSNGNTGGNYGGRQGGRNYGRSDNRGGNRRGGSEGTQPLAAQN